MKRRPCALLLNTLTRSCLTLQRLSMHSAPTLRPSHATQMIPEAGRLVLTPVSKNGYLLLREGRGDFFLLYHALVVSILLPRPHSSNFSSQILQFLLTLFTAVVFLVALTRKALPLLATSARWRARLCKAATACPPRLQWWFKPPCALLGTPL